jgi:hypothetical protein
MIASNRIAIHSLSLSIKYSGNPDYAACLGIAVPKNRIARFRFILCSSRSSAEKPVSAAPA